MSHYVSKPRRRSAFARFWRSIDQSHVLMPAIAIYFPVFWLAGLWWGLGAFWIAFIAFGELDRLRDDIKK